MKKTTQFLVFALVLSANLAFSQSKFSLVGGIKYYKESDYFIKNYPSQLGIFLGTYYNLSRRHSLAPKVEITTDGSKNIGFFWRYAFIKRSKIDIYVENGLNYWFYDTNKVVLTQLLGTNYHIDKNFSMAFQLELNTFSEKYKYKNTFDETGLFRRYAANLAVEYHF